jgi:hypothetical protein
MSSDQGKMVEQNQYDYQDTTTDDSKNIRSLRKSDIKGASPQKFNHKPRKYFVDRQEIMSVFNQNPGKYHGFKSDLKSGGTYIRDKPDFVFKWSLGENKKDLENRLKLKDENKP